MTGALAGLMVVGGSRVSDPPAEAIAASAPAVSIALPPSPVAEGMAEIRNAQNHFLHVAISLPGPAVHENVPIPRRKPSFWGHYRGEAARFPEAPKIAVIIDDMGLNVARSARVVSLRVPLTLSYLPYAHNLQRQTTIARAAGHELLVHVPMEPKTASAEPGPKVLALRLPVEANLRRLRWALSRFDGFVGINNHMGSRFTTDEAGMWPILRELKRRGLIFVDSLTDRRSAGGQIAAAIGLRFAKRDVFIDHVDDPAAIRRQLAELEQIARTAGGAVAIGHPRDATIAVLRTWIPEARSRGLEFVPISRIVQQRREQLIGTPAIPAAGDGPA